MFRRNLSTHRALWCSVPNWLPRHTYKECAVRPDMLNGSLQNIIILKKKEKRRKKGNLKRSTKQKLAWFHVSHLLDT